MPSFDPNTESGIGGIVVFLIILAFGILLYFFVVFPVIRGPAADMTIATKIDPTGNISKYSLDMHFVDSQSYTHFLQELYSQNQQTIEEQVNHEISSLKLFQITNDSKNNRIKITALTPLNPNQVFTNIKLTKSQNYWEFQDNSIANSSYISEKYVNKLIYTLEIPSKIINATTPENSSSFFYPKETTLTWMKDKNKNPLNPFGNNIDSQKIYVKFEVPEPTDHSSLILFGLAAAGLIGLFVVIFYWRR